MPTCWHSLKPEIALPASSWGSPILGTVPVGRPTSPCGGQAASNALLTQSLAPFQVQPPPVGRVFLCFAAYVEKVGLVLYS